MDYKEWKRYSDALEDLHYLANMYRVSGHMNEDVLGPYLTLSKLLYKLKPEEEKEPERSNIIDFYKK